jgi:hypothetical protein
VKNRYTTPHHNGITNAHQRRIKKRKQKRKVLVERINEGVGIIWVDDWLTGFYPNQIQMIGRANRGNSFNFSHLEMPPTLRPNPYEEIKR